MIRFAFVFTLVAFLLRTQHALIGLDFVEIDTFTINVNVNDTGDVDFGASVAMYKDYVVVGAPEQDNGEEESGAAYIFQWNNETNEYIKIFDLNPDRPTLTAYFGGSVAMNEDYVVVGSPHINGQKIFIYQKNDSTSWTRIKKIKRRSGIGGHSSLFGDSIYLSSNYCVVTAWFHSNNVSALNSGSVYVFDLNNNFTQIARIDSNNPYTGQHFGFSAAINESDHDDKCFLAIGSYNDDTVFIYQFNGTDWIEIDSISGPSGSYFGYSVAMKSNFEIVVGAPEDSFGDGKVYVYEYDSINNVWNEKTSISSTQDTNEYGTLIKVGSDFSLITDNLFLSHVYVYDNNWTKVHLLEDTSLREFGKAMSIYGDYCVIGAPGHSNVGDAAVYKAVVSNETTTTTYIPIDTTVGGYSTTDNYDTSTTQESISSTQGASTSGGSGHVSSNTVLCVCFFVISSCNW